MTQVEQLAAFVVNSSFSDISWAALRDLKIRVLDSLGCAIGALDNHLMQLLRDQAADFDGNGGCTVLGASQTAPDRAAFLNCALVRYLDFNDSYLAKGETCHPSDNLGAVLAASEYAGNSGQGFLTALAVAYQIQCRMSDAAPLRDRGFDHVTHGAYSVAAGVAKALSLDSERTANAVAISGASFNSLRVTRTGTLSHWKGLAFANMAAGATHAAFLAMRGVSGPREIFEGNKGFAATVSGPFTIDWSNETLELVSRTIVKKHNAEIHSQSAIECALNLQREYAFKAHDIDQIEIKIFDVAYKIIGGGEEGSKTEVRTKEQADHSLPYIIAVALLDGEVTPSQYRPERIARADVQDLLRKVSVRPVSEFSAAFPAEMPCSITVRLSGRQVFSKENRNYPGFPMSLVLWHTVEEKFHRLAHPYADAALRQQIVSAIDKLDQVDISVLTALLREVRMDTTRNLLSYGKSATNGDRAFPFIRMNQRQSKPRDYGLTEIRGPYYSAIGRRYLEDVLETMGDHIDSLKFAGGSFTLMPRARLQEIIELAHRYNVLVSTGGFIEYVLAHDSENVAAYIEECRNIGFDIVEISCGFITLPTDDWLRLVECVQKAGLKAKPEIGIQFGAGGATAVEDLEAEGTRDPAWAISQARRFLDAGAYIIMIESEGITENVTKWRTDVVAKFIDGLGLERVMFEAADPAVFAWYIKNYGPDVNLFVDHSQIVQLEALRRGIWGTKDLWGRIVTFKESEGERSRPRHSA
jgi:2-methylcitrate dehydratase